LLELLVDRDRLGRIERAVAVLRHVVELAKRGMAGARVVPRVGALLCHIGQSLEGDDLPVRLQFVEQSAQGGAHDATTDEDDVDGFSHPNSLVRPRGAPNHARGQAERPSATISAICTAFSAAPFRRLSLLTKSTIPLFSGADWSARMRPTKLGSLPAAYSGV